MAQKSVGEASEIRSGWCMGPLPKDVRPADKETAKKQHGGCKRVFEMTGYPTMTCICACHKTDL